MKKTFCKLFGHWFLNAAYYYKCERIKCVRCGKWFTAEDAEKTRAIWR